MRFFSHTKYTLADYLYLETVSLIGTFWHRNHSKQYLSLIVSYEWLSCFSVESFNPNSRCLLKHKNIICTHEPITCSVFEHIWTFRRKLIESCDKHCTSIDVATHADGCYFEIDYCNQRNGMFYSEIEDLIMRPLSGKTAISRQNTHNVIELILRWDLMWKFVVIIVASVAVIRTTLDCRETSVCICVFSTATLRRTWLRCSIIQLRRKVCQIRAI